LADWLEAAAAWFEGAASAVGAAAREYLAKRGLRDRLGPLPLGFSPPGRSAAEGLPGGQGGPAGELIETAC